MPKPWIVIDAHKHFVPGAGKGGNVSLEAKEYAALLEDSTGFTWQKAMDVERTLKDMDASGVDMAIMHEAAYGVNGLPGCQTMNNALAKITAEYPGRFIPCGTVPLQGGADILKEAERAINGLGLKGMALTSSGPDMTLDSEALYPLYEKISQLDVPVVIHPRSGVKLWGGTKYGMSTHVSKEYDVAKATVELLFGVLPKFPNIKFLVAHHGGGIHVIKGRIEERYEPDNWNIPPALKGKPKTPRELKELGIDKAFDQLWGKLYFDASGFAGWMPITELAIKVVGAKRVCFGTDYPIEIHDPQDVKTFIRKVKRLDIPDTQKRAVLGENIKTLFRIQ